MASRMFIIIIIILIRTFIIVVKRHGWFLILRMRREDIILDLFVSIQGFLNLETWLLRGGSWP